MDRSESGEQSAEAVDIESVMQEVRRQILERQLPGQLHLPDKAASLPPEYYEHLFRAGLAQSKVDVDVLVTPSSVPLLGPLIDRLRVKVHELVIFYINRFAENQARVTHHMLQALAVLGRPENRTGAPGQLPAGQAGSSVPRDDRATLDDVLAGYRLLLGREPDTSGWDYWSDLVMNQPVPRAFLVDTLLNSQEFKGLQADRFRPTLVELPDFKLYVRLNDISIGAGIARDKSYETHVSHVLEELLSPGMTFVDVGANIGYFSLLAAARVGPEGRVFAFEPNPANGELLRQSAAANGFEAIIDLRIAAVAEEAGMLRFVTPGVDSNGMIVGLNESAAVDLPAVEAVTLDHALADCDRVDIIKMDIEGAEARAWRGMQSIIRRHRPVMLFEFSPTLLRRTSDVDPAAFLEDVRSEYDLYIISTNGAVAPRPDSVAAIVEQHAAAGLAHLDILARPRTQLR